MEKFGGPRNFRKIMIPRKSSTSRKIGGLEVRKNHDIWKKWHIEKIGGTRKPRKFLIYWKRHIRTNRGYPEIRKITISRANRHLQVPDFKGPELYQKIASWSSRLHRRGFPDVQIHIRRPTISNRIQKQSTPHQRFLRFERNSNIATYQHSNTAT